MRYMEQAGEILGGLGAFAEMALANADTIAYKPKTLSHEEARWFTECRR